MTQVRTWPSKQLQVITIVVLAIGAMVRVFWQPLTPGARAEKLYEDSWFVGGENLFDEGRSVDHEAAISLLVTALKLRPGNSTYEQALVWHYDPATLPKLLKTRRLGAEAQHLAAARVADRAAGPSTATSDLLREPVDPRTAIARADILSKADPSNALPHYRRAFALQQLKRVDAAYAEMRIANRLGRIRFPEPQVPDQILDSVGAVLILPMGDFARFRRLAMALDADASDQLRHGKVEQARKTLEAGVEMSVHLSNAEPQTFINFLVGDTINAVTQVDLSPIYKDFGMRDKVARLQRLNAAYARGTNVCKSEDPLNRWCARMARPYTVPVILVFAARLALVPVILFALSWIPAGIIRRRRGQEALAVAPWNTGFLARIFLALYIPLLGAGLAVVNWWPHLLFPGNVPGLDLAGPALAIAVCSVDMFIIGLVFRVLHHRYDDHTGERTGMLRFIFQAPADSKAWTRKYLVAAMVGQVAFIACCALLAIIVYKPVFGGHPWQTSRFRVLARSHEQAIARQIGQDVLNAARTE